MTNIKHIKYKKAILFGIAKITDLMNNLKYIPYFQNDKEGEDIIKRNKIIYITMFFSFFLIIIPIITGMYLDSIGYKEIYLVFLMLPSFVIYFLSIFLQIKLSRKYQ